MEKNTNYTGSLMWKEAGEPQLLWEGPVFSIQGFPRINPAGLKRNMIVCDAPSWVTVIPELPGKGRDEPEFLMVRQYRHGSGALSCEFPAGVIDPGEEAVEAAARELREETGYSAGQMIEIGSINPNPAFMNNRSTTFLALDLKKTEKGLDLDENEFLDFRIEAFEHVAAHMGLGEYDSAIMVQAWFWYLKYRKRLKV